MPDLRLPDIAGGKGLEYDALIETVSNARFGVMPAWGDRLTEAQIRAVSAYVHQLGGGE